jgi:predicted Fe-Mo cluster-binding NifX family protein
MGGRALQLFAQHGIKVLTGAPALPPEDLVAQYMENNLQTGDNVCDH